MHHTECLVQFSVFIDEVFDHIFYKMQYFLLSFWVYSKHQSEGSVVLYCYRFMSSVSPVKSPHVHVHGSRTCTVHESRMWVICCIYISVTFITIHYVCVWCMCAYFHVIQVNVFCLCYMFTQNCATQCSDNLIINYDIHIICLYLLFMYIITFIFVISHRYTTAI